MTTNLERIRQMTADELAKWLNSKGRSCELCIYNSYKSCIYYSCTKGIKQWLEQESEE